MMSNFYQIESAAEKLRQCGGVGYLDPTLDMLGEFWASGAAIGIRGDL